MTSSSIKKGGTVLSVAKEGVGGDGERDTSAGKDRQQQSEKKPGRAAGPRARHKLGRVFEKLK